MKIQMLVENTTNNPKLENVHGLSIYIETTNHKILIDTGQNDAIIHNAKELNIDLSLVDITIITHGHNDHGGGLKAFLDINNKAEIYIQKSAFLEHYSKSSETVNNNISLNIELINHQQIHLLSGDYKIDNEISIITNPKIIYPKPKINNNLYEEINNKLFLDEFNHEQSVLINDGKTILIAGCAHNGILNIINDATVKHNTNIDYVIGGFHLYNRRMNQKEDDSTLDTLSKELLKFNAIYYTCHCTGIDAFSYLKDKMGSRINYIATGDYLEI